MRLFIKKYVLSVGLIIIAFTALEITAIYPQSLSGNVKDANTNSNISTSKVQIKNLDNGISDSVFTNSTGNWYYTLITSVENDDLIIPNSLVVDQNFPNPFNPSTRIQFSIPYDEYVEISVHNILGELIDHKAQFLSSGNYSIDWFSKGSAGVYFYTIKMGNQSVTKKMIQLDGGNGTGLNDFKSGIINYTNRSPKLQGIPIEIVVTKLGYLPDTTVTEISGNQFLQSHLVSVHSTSLMIDLHNDVIDVMISDPAYNFSIWNNYNHTDIPRLQAGGVDIQFFSLWVNPNTYTNHYDHTITMVNEFNSIMTDNPDAIQQSYTMNEAITINQQGKIAAVIGVEGGHSIESSLEKLENLFNLGMRYMTITWNNSLDWAIAHNHPNTLTQGLSEFGRSVIRTMDSLGIVIDVSHVGIKTIQDILEETTNPIIASHSGVRAITNSSRNLYDWQIQDIANSGGVIGIVFYPNFLTGTNSATINNVIQHIDHIVNLVGIDYVAIGSDFDGIGRTPVGLENVSKFPNLTLALLEHGYSISDVKKILGENAKRVFDEVVNNSKVLKNKSIAVN
ncbi:MAG TPA: membrane dipeptidase [Ignavibacteriaceae bacterium]|nr:membrane dipeptidase [Ignavibacteriaceae bacterium]